MTGIIFANIVLGILVMVLLFKTRWNAVIKVAAVLGVSMFYYATVQSYPTLMGWPTSVDLPKRFKLEGLMFDEPNKSTQSKGRIFIWITDLRDFRKPVPRAYVLPYTPALHTNLYDAGQKLRRSLPQLGEVVMMRNAVTAKEEVNLQFFDMPDVLLPK